VLDLVFPYQAKRLAWGMSPIWPTLCRVGRKTCKTSAHQSISRSNSSHCLAGRKCRHCTVT